MPLVQSNKLTNFDKCLRTIAITGIGLFACQLFCPPQIAGLMGFLAFFLAPLAADPQIAFLGVIANILRIPHLIAILAGMWLFYKDEADYTKKDVYFYLGYAWGGAFAIYTVIGIIGFFLFFLFCGAAGGAQQPKTGTYYQRCERLKQKYGSDWESHKHEEGLWF